MKIRPYLLSLVPTCLLLLLLASGSPPATAQVATNWIAFNDHRPTTNTSPNATGWEMGPFGDTNGPLRDFVTGGELEAVMYTTFTLGSDNTQPDNFGANGDPAVGTPAYDLFNGIVDVGSSPGTSDGDGIVGVRAGVGTTVTLVFTNLNPSQRYVFLGTGVRANFANYYPDRWALFTIQGTENFVDAHVDTSPDNNLFTSVDFPAAGLTAGQVALHTGNNTNGSLVGWDDINPGPDGSFSIRAEQFIGTAPYGNPSAGPYGYTIDAMMLLEVGNPLPASIQTQPPATVTVFENRPINLTVLAQGAPLPTYQWHKVGVGPIAGANRRTYSVPNAALDDAGEYYVVVSNPQNTVTSSTTQVTVLEDNAAPAIVSITAVAGGAVSEVRIVFDEELDPVSANDDFIFTVNGFGPTNTTQVAPNTVSLGFDFALTACTTYQLGIAGLFDLFSNGLNANVDFLAAVQLLAPGDNQPWRYNQEGIDLGTDWLAPGYDDSGWTSGMQLFDVSTTPRTELPNLVPVATTLQLGNPTSSFSTNNLPTTYLRTHFNLPTGPGNVTRLRTRLLLDDGAVLYLNGVEAYRQNVLEGTEFSAYGGGNIGTADYQTVEVDPSALQEGLNVLAVELKNNSATSSDLTFGIEMIADISSCAPSAPRLTITRSGSQITSPWPGGGGILQRTSALPGGWANVNEAASPYTFTTTGEPAFFRVELP